MIRIRHYIYVCKQKTMKHKKFKIPVMKLKIQLKREFPLMSGHDYKQCL